MAHVGGTALPYNPLRLCRHDPADGAILPHSPSLSHSPTQFNFFALALHSPVKPSKMDPTSSPLINPATTPSGKPPLGQTIDFSSPENRATLYIGVSSVLAGISFIFVALKLYTRAFIQNKLGWDDCKFILHPAVHGGHLLIAYQWRR